VQAHDAAARSPGQGATDFLYRVGVGSAVAGQRLRHVPALDGLRGVALLGVVLFHANGALPGGYLGVDLFFVLSGFLITSILLAEHAATGRIALSDFWIRRARRLFPALLSLMPAIALYGRFFAKPEELSGLRGDALATLGYVANWRTILSHKSYWELFAAPSLLEHTWSLSIEEQFYVVWPLLVAVLLRSGGPRRILALAVALGALSMAATALLWDPAHVSRVYLGTDTRAAALLAGASLATILSRGAPLSTRAVRALDASAAVSAAGLGVAWCTLRGESPFLYRGGFWLTEAAALVLVACAVLGENSVVARVLSVRPLTVVGTLSYGLYLWHWPVDVLLSEARVHTHGLPLHALQLAVTFAIATASYHFLERPIRTHGLPFGRAVVMLPTAVAIAVLLVVRATYARPLAPPTASTAPVEDAVPTTFRVLVLGDSTANSLGWGLRGVRRPGVSVELHGKDGCTMLADTCGGSEWATDERALGPDATLVFLGGAFLHGLPLDEGWRKSCYPGWDKKFVENLARRLAALPANARRVWIATVPYPLGSYDSSTFREEVDCINSDIRSAVGLAPGVSVLDLAPRLCPGGVCERESDGVLIRPDGVHYAMDGGARISRWVLDQLQSRSAERDK